MDLATAVAEVLAEDAPPGSPARYLLCLLRRDLPGAVRELALYPRLAEDPELGAALRTLQGKSTDGAAEGEPSSVESHKYVINGKVYVATAPALVEQLAGALAQLRARQPPPSPAQFAHLLGDRLLALYKCAHSRDPVVLNDTFSSPALSEQEHRLREALLRLPAYLAKRAKKFKLTPAELPAPDASVSALLATARLAHQLVHQQDLAILAASVPATDSHSALSEEDLATQAAIRGSFQELKTRRRHLCRLAEAIATAERLQANLPGGSDEPLPATPPDPPAQLAFLRRQLPRIVAVCDAMAHLATYLAEISDSLEQLLDPAASGTCILPLVRLVRHLVRLERHHPVLRAELFKYPSLERGARLDPATLSHFV